jgi:hypothetical protein
MANLCLVFKIWQNLPLSTVTYESRPAVVTR